MTGASQVQAWLVPPTRPTRPKKVVDPLERDLDRARAALQRWHRKEALARTMVGKYSRTVARLLARRESKGKTLLRVFGED